MIWRYLVPLFWGNLHIFPNIRTSTFVLQVEGLMRLHPQISAVLRTNGRFPGQNLYVSVFFVASSAIFLAKVMTSLDFTPVLSFFVSKTRPGRQSPTCGEHRAVTGIWRFTTGGHFALKAWRGILEPMAPWFYLVYLDPWLPGNGKSHIFCRWMWFMLVNVENSSTSWPWLRLSQRFFGVKSLNGTIRICGDPRSSSNGQLYHSDLNNNYGTMNSIGLW